MKYKVFIDQLKGQQFDLNVNEVAFMDLIIHLEGWADRYMIDEQLYYFIGRSKVVAELPLFFKQMIRCIGILDPCRRKR